MALCISSHSSPLQQPCSPSIYWEQVINNLVCIDILIVDMGLSRLCQCSDLQEIEFLTHLLMGIWMLCSHIIARHEVVMNVM
jgi:hypothetical protein